MTLTRRGFFTAAITGSAALAGDGLVLEPRHVVVSRHTVPVAGLPAELDGLTLAQITDTHLPANQPAAAVALEHLRREKPDIVMLTGDILERRRAMSVLYDFARDAQGTLATVAMLGNHEYARAVPLGELESNYGRAGVQLLRNSRAMVSVRGHAVELVGFDDAIESTVDLSVVTHDAADAALRVWSVHEPGYVRALPASLPARPNLVLAGHTHGGQVRVPGLPPVLPAMSGGYVGGWYTGLVAPLYVSRGVGTSGLPVRFMCPAEVPIFTFRRA